MAAPNRHRRNTDDATVPIRNVPMAVLVGIDSFDEEPTVDESPGFAERESHRERCAIPVIREVKS